MSQAQNTQETSYSLFDGINVPIFVMEPSTKKILYYNASMQNLVGLRDNQLAGREAIPLFTKESRNKVEAVCEILTVSPEESETNELDLSVKRKSGRSVPVNLHAKSVKARDTYHIVFSLHDISMLKQYQEDRENALKEISRMTKLADIGRLTAGVAHEMNNPLMIIQGFAENIESLLEQNQTDPQSIRKQLDPILKSVHRMSTIISNMTRMARDDDVTFVEVSVADVVDDVLKLMNNQLKHTDVQVEKELNAGSSIRCDPNQIEQIILNILSNALHALEKTDHNNKKICVSENVFEDMVTLSFWNNGPPIPDDIKDRIMTPFFTTKDVGEGTGLGLSVSYGIMQAHGGDLSFESSENKGTTFTLAFPQAERRKAALNKGQAKILVVDDELFARQVFGNKLRSYGYQVVQAQNGHEALEIAQSDPGIIAVFMDVRMPKMDGREAIKNIKEIAPYIFAVAVSGYLDQNSLKKETQKMDIEAYLTKPMDDIQFNHVMKQIKSRVTRHSSQEAG